MCDSKAVPLMLGIKETAEMYGLPVHFVRALVNNGDVTAIRVGRKILVNADKFCEYLNSNKLQPVNEIAKDETDTSSNIVGPLSRISAIPAGRGR